MLIGPPRGTPKSLDAAGARILLNHPEGLLQIPIRAKRELKIFYVF